jgi:K+-sensing histidine kinase KdpD
MTVTSRRLTAAARTRASGHRHLLTLAVAGVLFVGVLSLRLFAGDATDAYSMLYVFPVALVATTFGMRAGTAAGLLAVALIAVWATADHVSLAPVAWAARVLPILLLGVLVGEATDRLRRIEAERRLLEAAALLHREAIEINDSLVQGMAAAKWSLEAGSVDAGLRVLDDTIARGHDLVSGLIRRADMGGRTESLAEADPTSTR